MKIIKKDVRHGVVSVKPENLDDLWILEKIISLGDIISGKSLRTISIERDGQKEKGRRVNVFLKVKVEEIDFSSEGGELRAKGKILEGPDTVSHGYHSFEIRVNEPVTIEKEWRKYQIDVLEKAKKKQEPVLICIMDDGEADFALLTRQLAFLSSVSASSHGASGKQFGESSRKEYYGEIISLIRHYRERYKTNNIILAGPGFGKDNVMKIIKEEKELAAAVFLDTVAHTGRPGFQEILRRGVVERIVKENNISQQTQLVNRFFEEISKNGLVVYGLKETEHYIDMGSVDILLISDKLVHDHETLLEKAEKLGASVHIIESTHEAGDRFFALGGIGGLLRYKI